MEDFHCVKINLYNEYDFIAVFDGHGGSAVSEFLKFHLKDFVKKHLEQNKYPTRALRDAFFEAHESMPIEMSNTTGSAAIVILRKHREMWVANCGDCRAIMSSKVKSVSLSTDHKPNRDDEMARIKQLGGTVTFNPNDVPRVQGNLALSRSLGDKYLSPYVICEPEIRHFNIVDENKYIIMASDGLWDVYENQDVINSISNTFSVPNKKQVKTLMREACHDLLNGSRMRMSGDNITIIFWILYKYFNKVVNG
jgi:serine/threonine protein phosphatase PrpC